MNAIPLGLATLLLILALFLAGMALLIQYLNPEPGRLPFGFLAAACVCVLLATFIVKRWPAC